MTIEFPYIFFMLFCSCLCAYFPKAGFKMRTDVVKRYKETGGDSDGSRSDRQVFAVTTSLASTFEMKQMNQ